MATGYFWRHDGQNPSDGSWIQTDSLVGMCIAGFVYNDSPEAIADYVYAQAILRPEGKVAILLRHPGQQRPGLQNMYDCSVLSWASGNAVIDPHVDHLMRFFNRLKYHDPTNALDPIYFLDYEKGDSNGQRTWDTYKYGNDFDANATFLELVCTHPEVSKYLPASLRGMTKSQWLTVLDLYGETGGEAIGVWWLFDRLIMTRANRDIVLRAYTNVYGRLPRKLSNYEDYNSDYPWYDSLGQGYPATRQTVAGWSALSPYFSNQSAQTWSRFNVGNVNGVVGRRWNFFLDQLINRMGRISGPRTVWVSKSRFAGTDTLMFTSPNVWKYILGHAFAAGCDEDVAVYCPQWNSTERNEMSEFLATLRPSTGFDPDRFQPAPMNAASVTTNGYTTTYNASDFAIVGD